MNLTEEMAKRHIDHIIKVELPQALEKNDFGNIRVLGRNLEDYVLDMESKLGLDILTQVEKEGFVLDIDMEALN